MTTTKGNRLAAVLQAAVCRGVFPQEDGVTEILPPPPGRAMGVIAFKAHFVVASSAPAKWIRDQLPTGDFLAPMSPRFLVALEERLARRSDGVDVLLGAVGLPGVSALRETGLTTHTRVRRAVAHRLDVRAYEDQGRATLVTLGSGLAGRIEVSVEVHESRLGRGLGTSALLDARRIVGPGRALFAQVAPGNAASLRSALAAGFVPLGSEALFFADRPIV